VSGTTAPPRQGPGSSVPAQYIQYCVDVWYKNNFIWETTNELRVIEEAIHAYGQMAVIHITEHI